MIEQFVIFTKGGLVLFSKVVTRLQGTPFNNLIKSILIEVKPRHLTPLLLQERSNESQFVDGKYTVKWTLANEVGLVFAVAYQTVLAGSIKYTDDLLDTVRRYFTRTYKDILADPKSILPVTDFEARFDRIYAEAENSRKATKQGPTPFEQTAKGQKLAKAASKSGKQVKTPKAKQGKGEQTAEDDNDDETTEDTDTKDEGIPAEDSAANDPNSGADQSATAADAGQASAPAEETGDGVMSQEERQAFLEKKGAKKTGNKAPAPYKPKQKAATAASPASPKKKPTKQMAEKASGKRLTQKEIDALNRGPDGGVQGNLGASYNVGNAVNLDDDIDFDEEIDEQKATGGVLSYFKSLTGAVLGKELTVADLQPVLDQIRDHLIAKNVAAEIAAKLCESVGNNLVGKQLGSFTRVSSTVRDAMKQALTQILTPKRKIDVLRDIHDAQEHQRPYSIVFVGVNGVGKSTSLSKVCSWLLQQNLNVMIAGCDTFRAGSLEQLETHCRNLGVPLFHSGYGKDPASVAKAGLSKAAKDKVDVVLIDTAGRMQGKEDLMRELGKLVEVNNPDLIVFVGEALVGNDSVDQLVHFNRALEKYGSQANPRLVDGIFLTKFDTVDDKVGAAISMVYTTGQPILFIGVGQNYTDIKTLNTNRIVQILLQGR